MRYVFKVQAASGKAGDRTFTELGLPFTAELLHGGPYDFGKFVGKRPAVVTFWASWCGPCLVEAPHLAAIYKKHHASGLELISISIDEAGDHEKLRKVVARFSLPYPVALDPKGEILARYAKGSSIPLTFVLDASGAVVHRQQNFEPGDEVALNKIVDEVMSRSPRTR